MELVVDQGLDYCSPNGGDLDKDPYFNLNHHVGARIIAIYGRFPLSYSQDSG